MLRKKFSFFFLIFLFFHCEKLSSQRQYTDTSGDTQTPYVDSATSGILPVYNFPDTLSLHHLLHLHVVMRDSITLNYFSLSLIDSRDFRFAIYHEGEFSYEWPTINIAIESPEFYSWTSPLRKGWRGYADVIPRYHSTNPVITYCLGRVYCNDGTVIGENPLASSGSFEKFPSQIISVTASLLDSSVELMNCGYIKFSRTFNYKIITSSDPAMNGLTISVETGDCPLERYGPNYFVTGKTYVLRIKREYIDHPPFVQYELAEK